MTQILHHIIMRMPILLKNLSSILIFVSMSVIGYGYAPEVLDGWVLRLEIEAGDGEDVDILSFEGGQVMESDEQGDYSENLGDYIYERFEDGSASVTIYETDGAPNVLNFELLSRYRAL